ncbi:hypothetical protein LXL04_008550 [Taraxacum kok-saghyz]
MYQGSNIMFPGYEMYQEHHMVLRVAVGFDFESQNLKNSLANMDFENKFVVDFDRVIEVLEFLILPRTAIDSAFTSVTRSFTFPPSIHLTVKFLYFTNCFDENLTTN